MCEVCNDRGFIVDDLKNNKRCICSVTKDLSSFLGSLKPYKLDKSVNELKLNQNIIVSGKSRDDYYSLIKSFLFKMYFKDNLNKSSFRVVTAQEIVECYVTTSLSEYFDIPYVFMDLTMFLQNKALGDSLMYVIEQRVMRGKVTWVYIGKLQPNNIIEIYHKRLQELIWSFASVM